MAGRVDGEDEVRVARKTAARLLEDAEKRKRKRDHERKTQVEGENEPVEKTSQDKAKDAENRKSKEAALNEACSKAKAAWKAAPTDSALAAAYTEAKAAFREYQQSKMKAAEQWHCELCDFSMAASLRECHLRSKKHLSFSEKTASESSSVLPAASSKAMYSCRLCGVTLAHSAQATHEIGKKHRAKLFEVAKLWRAGELKKGDWICVAHGWHVCSNFASNTQCRRADCQAMKTQGLSYKEAQELERMAARTGDQMAAVHASSSDVQLTCRDCRAPFVFSAQEQAFFEEKSFVRPSRCVECRGKNKKRKTATEAR